MKGGSRYAHKMEGKAELKHHRSGRPLCSGCGGRLLGKKSHGFPGLGGRGLYCGGCRKK